MNWVYRITPLRNEVTLSIIVDIISQKIYKPANSYYTAPLLKISVIPRPQYKTVHIFRSFELEAANEDTFESLSP